MTRFKRILFPVDFSERCRLVRPFVEAMARAFDSELTLMHVIPMSSSVYAGFETAYEITVDYDAMKRDAAIMLEEFLDTPRPPSTVVRVGDPATEIVNYAESNRVDLVMMPTHGYGPFRALLLGSVTAKVLHDVTCPVWTSAHAEDLPAADRTNLKSIMCALDLTTNSMPILRDSAHLAERFGAKLRIVHAVPGAEVVDPRFGTDFSNFLLQTAREDAMALQKQAGMNFDVCIGGGPVATVVHDAAVHHDAGLVVIGRGHLRSTLGRLRTNAYAIIGRSPCPVLSF